MTPAAKSARLQLLRASWERYRRKHRRVASVLEMATHKLALTTEAYYLRLCGRGAASEPSGSSYLADGVAEENLATYANVGVPDMLSELPPSRTGPQPHLHQETYRSAPGARRWPGQVP